MKKAVLSLFLIAFLFGCLSTEPTCKSPYIEYQKGSCCLDANSNNICDTDETTTTILTITTTIPPDAVIEGYIKDKSSNEPLTGLRVDVIGNRGNFHVYTDATGYYKVDVPHGKYTIFVRFGSSNPSQTVNVDTGVTQSVDFRIA